MNNERHAKYGLSAPKVDTRYVDLGIDMHTLDMLCRLVVSGNKHIRRGELTNILTMLNNINPDKYMNDPEKAKRFSFIRKGIEGRLNYNLDDPYMIIQHINGGIIDGTIVDLDTYKEMPDMEIKWICDMVSETLCYGFVYNHADYLMDICSRFRTNTFGTKGEIVKEFKDAINMIQNDFRRAQHEDHTEAMFSLTSGVFEDAVTDTFMRLANPKHKLVTGMQGMNELLGGGFEPARVYCYFGLPGVA